MFLLREVFDYGYDEIADVVGKSEDNCRQIAVRARRHVEAKRPRFEALRQRREELARRFFDAALKGDTECFIGLLAADVVAYGDGGGRAPAYSHPIYGRERVARLMLGATAWLASLRASAIRHVEINGQPGALILDPDGRPVVAISLDSADDLVQSIRGIVNPEKLLHLGAFALHRVRSRNPQGPTSSGS